MDISASAFSSGLVGMQTGYQRVEQAAERIAAGVSTPQELSTVSLSDMAQQMVELEMGRNIVEANAQVVETADELLGTLIDIRS